MLGFAISAQSTQFRGFRSDTIYSAPFQVVEFLNMPIRLTQEDTMGGARRQGHTTTRRGYLSQPDRHVLKIPPLILTY